MRVFSSFTVLATAATGVSGLNLKNKMLSRTSDPESKEQDFGFMGEGDLPEICGVKTLTSGQEDWLVGFHKSIQHAGVRKQLATVFSNPLKCWYGKMLYADGCGSLKPQRTTTPDRRALQEKCRDPKIGFKALFADQIVTEEERMYLIKNYPTRKDLEGEPIEGSYSDVMETLYKIGGKEVLCQSLELIDDGCKEAGPFKEY